MVAHYIHAYSNSVCVQELINLKTVVGNIGIVVSWNAYLNFEVLDSCLLHPLKFAKIGAVSVEIFSFFRFVNLILM